MALEINQTVEVTAHETDRFGQGVARYEDRVIFTPGLLQDETATVTIIKDKKSYLEAKIKKILKKSDKRKTMPSLLGSLDLYHLNDDEQALWQQRITQDALKRQSGLEVEVSPTLMGENQLNYRNKSVYHVLDDTNLRLGLFMKEPIELKEVHTFILNSLAIQRCISKIQQQSIKVDPKIFKHIVLRSNEKEEVLVTLVAYEEKFEGLLELINVIKKFKEVVGITLNIKPNESVILGQKSILLYGKNELNYQLKHLKLKLNDRSFMQVNSEMMIKTYELIRERVTGQNIIDAYSGIGSIGYFIGDKAKKVTMIENNSENVEMAKSNRSNHKGNYEIVLGNTENMLPKYKNADTIILDPPRAGLHPSLLKHLNNEKINQIIYLSCELNTLTRDLKELSKVYDVTEVIPLRMFPQTTSLETLVILKLK